MGASYRGVARELAGVGDASVFGSDRTASADIAALINGGLIHSLEYDDTHTASIVHGSSVLAATALAVGQSTGRVGRRRARRLCARLGDFRAARPGGAGRVPARGIPDHLGGRYDRGGAGRGRHRAPRRGCRGERGRHRTQPVFGRIRISYQRFVREVAASRLGRACRRPRGAFCAGGHDRTPRRRWKAIVDCSSGSRTRRTPRTASPNCSTTSARAGICQTPRSSSILAVTICTPSSKARSRCARSGLKTRRCRRTHLPDRARRGADRVPAVGGAAGGVRSPDALEPAGRRGGGSA